MKFTEALYLSTLTYYLDDFKIEDVVANHSFSDSNIFPFNVNLRSIGGTTQFMNGKVNNELEGQ